VPREGLVGVSAVGAHGSGLSNMGISDLQP
jgi:hypothetical protein